MKQWRMGTGIILGLLVIGTEGRAQIGGGAGPRGPTSLATAHLHGMSAPNGPGGMGMSGMVGGSMGGGLIGMPYYGCCGGFSQPLQVMGGTGFSGMVGFPGCCWGPCGCWGFPTFPFNGLNAIPAATQSYSKWTPSPNKTYYFRTLSIQTPAPNEALVEFIAVHYPDRPKYFYYFDAVEKKYVGRYRVGAGPTECFNLIAFGDRKAHLKDIPESAFENATAMPMVPSLIYTRPGTTIEPYLQNLTLLRPPDAVPDQLLGLPPEEKGLKKMIEKD